MIVSSCRISASRMLASESFAPSVEAASLWTPLP